MKSLRGDSLGDRMKGYEKVPSNKLLRRMPVIIRLDGKAFHTYTRGMDKPFDNDLSYVRQKTLNELCDNIQGVIMGYSQSDELSLVLKDWDTFQTNAWFDNKIQKLCSVSASMCTAYWSRHADAVDMVRTTGQDKFSGKLALFDSRCFNLPKEEVVNYLLWRQQDWERNSIQMLAQSFYSHKELQGWSCKALVTRIEEEQGVIWRQLPNNQKRGEFWIKGKGEVTQTPLFKDIRSDLETLLYKEDN